MTDAARPKPGHWTAGELPPNVRVGLNSVIAADDVTGGRSFKRFFSRLDPALTIGDHCTMQDVFFSLGEQARVEIGDYCYFKDAILVCELEVRIGSYVMIGFSATIADADFHPLNPSERMADVIAVSPLGRGRARRPFVRKPVIIDNDVLIGPRAMILKGVHVGAGAFVEAGSVVVHDVPPRARVMGNPAQVIGEV